jgi:citrate lyase alpha subunit
MTDPLQSLLQAAQLPSNNLPVTSRYYHIGTAMIDRPDGQPIVYLKRRFVPPPEHYISIQQHIVAQGERLDNITAKYMVDPEQFWQVADANLAMQPQELTEESGRILDIPQEAGLSE